MGVGCACGYEAVGAVGGVTLDLRCGLWLLYWVCVWCGYELVAMGCGLWVAVYGVHIYLCMHLTRKGNLEEVVTFVFAKSHLSMCNSERNRGTHRNIGYTSFLTSFWHLH